MVLLCVFPDLSSFFLRCLESVQTVPPCSTRTFHLLRLMHDDRSPAARPEEGLPLDPDVGSVGSSWDLHESLDCFFREKSTGNHYKWWYIPWIPVKIFPEKGPFSRENLHRKHKNSAGKDPFLNGRFSHQSIEIDPDK